MLKHCAVLTTLLLAMLLPKLAIANDTAVDGDRKSFGITMKNHRFDPLELIVPLNQKLKIVIRNQDTSPIEFQSEQLRRTLIVQPGSEATLLFEPLVIPGTYRYYDDFHSFSKGYITVK